MRSYRDAILETIRLALLDMETGLPLDDPYAYGFSTVTRADQLPPAKMVRYVANVSPGDEIKAVNTRFNDCQLPVMIDFAFRLNTGDPTASEMVEILLADLQRRIYLDRSLNGLAIDTREEGNTVALSSSEDKQLEGTLFLNVFYRHDLDDPRKFCGEPPADPHPTSGEPT